MERRVWSLSLSLACSGPLERPFRPSCVCTSGASGSPAFSVTPLWHPLYSCLEFSSLHVCANGIRLARWNPCGLVLVSLRFVRRAEFSGRQPRVPFFEDQFWEEALRLPTICPAPSFHCHGSNHLPFQRHSFHGRRGMRNATEIKDETMLSGDNPQSESKPQVCQSTLQKKFTL